MSQLVDLAVEVDVDVLEFVLDGDEVPQHAVEGVAEFFEFVTGPDFGSEFEVALCDGVADFLEVHHRLGDHVADNEVEGEDGEDDLDEFGGDDEGEDAVKRGSSAVQWHADPDDTDQVTGFVRMDGYPMGVIASDSQHINGGALTAEGCDKLKRHLDVCDLFHIPVLNLVDNPGFAVGLEYELAGTIRRGGEWMVAFAQVQVPIFTVLMRRSFGVAGNNYATPQARPSVRVVWPAADVGGIPPEGGIEARAISYAKGCYIGQEIISRIRSRGKVNRILRGLRLDGAAVEGDASGLSDSIARP